MTEGREELVLEAIDAGLNAVGDRVKDMFYGYLENTFQVDKSEIPFVPQLLRIGLARIIGAGAVNIETLIVQELANRLGEELSGADLLRAVKTAMARRGEFPEVSINNILAVANVHQTVDLTVLVRIIPNAKYFSKKFRALLVRQPESKVNVFVFQSGSIVCTGANSVEEANNSIRRLTRMLVKCGIRPQGEIETEVRNIVASACFGKTVHIERTARELPRSIYEPEQFPGLIHRMDSPKLAITLFSSGKIVLTGAKREADIYRAVNRLAEILAKP
ncbi:MAG: hypothetical protein HYU39_09735 [Thaumarchaeota archaeon]|nr:hypothetical protein [Nitrososphaerota archaeon]